MNRDELARQVQATLGRATGAPVCAWLFGSRARGDDHAESDIDIAVLLGREPEPGLSGLGFDLQASLETALGEKVDVVIMERASIDLVHKIMRDGILLYDNDPSCRVRFEVQARNRYFDLLPTLNAYRRQAGKVSS